jgi:hypothetical protein
LATRNSSTGTATIVAFAADLLGVVATFVLTAALVVVVSEAVLGRRISIEGAWLRVRPRLLPIIGASLLVTIIWFVATPFFLAPGVYFYVLLSLAVPAVVLEGQPVRASLRRSSSLIRGAWWRTFGILLLGLLVQVVISGVITLVLGIIGGLVAGSSATSAGGLLTVSGVLGLSVGALLVRAVISIVAASVTRPIYAGVVALVYVDRRIRAEGLDVTLAEAARGGQSGSP